MPGIGERDSPKFEHGMRDFFFLPECWEVGKSYV